MLDIDFVVGPRPLTKADEKAVREFIRADKEKRKLKELGEKAATRRKAQQPI